MSQFVFGESKPLVETLKLFQFNRFQENDLVKSPIGYSLAKGLR
jgi:hypothetical protein